MCVSRLVPRKGQDALIRALPAIRRRVPDAALLVVSGGPHRRTLERMAREAGLAGDVVFTTLGFAGLYLVLGMLFVLQVLKEISRGPEGKGHDPAPAGGGPEPAAAPGR